MGLIRGFTDEIKMNADLAALGAIENELLNVTLDRIGMTSSNPVFLHASFPTEDSLLHIESSLLEIGDGGSKSVPPIDDLIPTPTVATTIDFQTGAVVGQTVTVNGGAFALPTGTVGQYRRFALVLRNTGTIDTLFSSEQTTIGALTNAGTMLATLNTTIIGLPLGWVDLECDNVSGKYRTAGSATAIIENKVGTSYRVNRFGAGGGGTSKAAADAEASARIAADSTLQANINLEITARQNGDSTLQSNLNLEITARQNSDSTITSNLNLEITARQNGDSTLQNNINSEITNRTNADNLEITARSDADSTLQSNLNLEVTARQNSDSTITSNLNLEITARQNGDSTLTSNLNLEITARSNGDSTLQSNLNSEITARINGDLAILPFVEKAFTLDSVASNGTIIINGGYIALNNDGIIATYDGSGTTETDFGDGVNLTFDLDTLQPSAVNGTTYYLYVDIYSLPTPTTLTDTGRKLIPVTASNFVLLTEDFESVFQFRYVKIGVVRRATGVWDTTVAESYPIKKQQYPNIVLSPVVFSVEKTIGSVGSLNQVNSGHNLTSASFPSTQYPTKISFYSLTGLTDGNTSLNHTLTNNGSTPFTGTGIVGGASTCASLNGTSQWLSSTDAHFNPSGDWIMGGWFYPTSYTPASDQTLFSSWASGNQKFRIDLLTTGDIKIYSSLTGSDSTITTTAIDFTPGWSHIALQYIAADQKLYLYIDSILIGAHIVGGALYSPVSPSFALGARAGGSNLYSGLIDEFFACNGYAFTDDEVAKVYSAKISHSSMVAKYQDWRATITYGEFSAQITDFIVDMTDDALYLDLSGQSPASTIYLALYNSTLNGVVNVSVSRMFEGTAAQIDALGTFAHNLPSMPTMLSLLADAGSGYYEYRDASAFFKANSTQIAPKGGSNLSTVLGASTYVKLLVSVGPAAVFTETSVWSTKVKTAAYGLVKGDEILADTTTSGFILTLPATPSLGDRVRIIDKKGTWAANNVTVARNGNKIDGLASDLTLSVNNKKVELVFDGTDNWIVISS